MLESMELTTLKNILLEEPAAMVLSVLQTSKFEVSMIHIKQTETVLITDATTIWTYLWMCLMTMDLCMDLTGSGSWILT